MILATEILLDAVLVSYLVRHGTPLMGLIIGGLVFTSRVMGWL